MSTYPPPPPPYPPYDSRFAKDQRRLQKQQIKWQRQQARLQYRSLRRRSIVGPLVILALGIVFLLAQTGRVTWGASLDWYAHWWPVVLIAAGLLLLAEWGLDQSTQSDGLPRPSRSIGAGVVILLILLGVAGLGAHGLEHGLQWKDRNFGAGFDGWDVALGNQYEWDDQATAALPAGATLIIRDPHGDVSVTGSSPDGQVHVSVHKHARATSDSVAADRERDLQPVFSTDGSNLVLSVSSVRGGSADLTIQLPHDAPLTINADDGEVSVQEIHGAVAISANHGEINLSGIDGPVTAHVNNNDTGFSAHSIHGGIDVEGHAGDINISDITGPVILDGAFFGTTHLERVDGAVTFSTYRTHFTAARLDGDFDVSTDSELQASEVLGPVLLKTTDRDITLDRVQGAVTISNTDGPVKVTNATPLSTIDISNHDGSVDVGLPTDAVFTLSAQTRDGDIENDFGLKSERSDDQHMLTGQVGQGGPLVKIVTGEGDVTIHKTTVAPLPPLPPLPPRITAAPPPAPPAPHSPKAPKGPKTPTAPQAPAAPKAPTAPAASATF